MIEDSLGNEMNVLKSGTTIVVICQKDEIGITISK